jgi:hypothetical protein
VTPPADAAAVWSWFPPGFDPRRVVAAPLAVAPAAAVAPPIAPGPPAVAAPPAQTRRKAQAGPRRGVVAGVERQHIALYFTVNDRPLEVVKVMDSTLEQHRALLSQTSGRQPWVYALLWLGLLGFVGDYCAGYASFVLGYAGLVCWLAAWVLHRSLARQRLELLATSPKRGCLIVPTALACCASLLALGLGIIGSEDELTLAAALSLTLWLCLLVRLQSSATRLDLASPFDERFTEARAILLRLKDDLPRNYPLLGWLDLTGLGQSKVVREGVAPSGAPLTLYRDEWLRLKLKLADGNVMRVSALESVRKKEAFWKQGRRKQKRRPGVTEARHQLKVSVVVDGKTHAIRPPPERGSLQQIQLTTQLATADRLVVNAATAEPLRADHILQVLKLVYSHVVPRAALD